MTVAHRSEPCRNDFFREVCLLVCTGIMGILRKYSFFVSFLFSQAHLDSGNKSVLTLPKLVFLTIWIHSCALILQQLTKI